MIPNKCTRCDDDVIAKHPAAWMLVDVRAPLLDALGDGPTFGMDRNLLCADCMILLGEFLVPELLSDTTWTSGKDQLHAQLRDIKAQRGMP